MRDRVFGFIMLLVVLQARHDAVIGYDISEVVDGFDNESKRKRFMSGREEAYNWLLANYPEIAASLDSCDVDLLCSLRRRDLKDFQSGAFDPLDSMGYIHKSRKRVL